MGIEKKSQNSIKPGDKIEVRYEDMLARGHVVEIEWHQHIEVIKFKAGETMFNVLRSEKGCFLFKLNGPPVVLSLL